MKARTTGANTSEPTLLLGLGNILYGDEGVGVHMLHHLRRKYQFPDWLELLDGGALGWHLVEYLAAYPRVIIVDAVAAELGAIYRFNHHAIPAAVKYGKLSSHEWEVPELLWMMELHGDAPDTTIIAIGVDPLEMLTEQVAVGLTERVLARMPDLELAIVQELQGRGIHPLSAKESLVFDTDLVQMARVA